MDQEHPFSDGGCALSLSLDSALGFSTAAIPRFLPGDSAEHGRLSLFHRANGHSPFAKLRLYLRDAAADGGEPLRALRGEDDCAPDDRLSGIFEPVRGAAEIICRKLSIWREARHLRAGRNPDSC